jgi:hypothetical protein
MAENRSEEVVGMELLVEALNRKRGLPLDETVALIMEGIEQWSAPDGFTDDASSLAI